MSLKTITSYKELDDFIENNEGFNFYIANPYRMIFLKYDKEHMPSSECYYIKSDEDRITLVDIKLKNIETVKISIEKEQK